MQVTLDERTERLGAMGVDVPLLFPGRVGHRRGPASDLPLEARSLGGSRVRGRYEVPTVCKHPRNTEAQSGGLLVRRNLTPEFTPCRPSSDSSTPGGQSHRDGQSLRNWENL